MTRRWLRAAFLAAAPLSAFADARLFLTAANGLIASMAAFVIGGAFVAIALNDLTWIRLALGASLDRISARTCEEASSTAPQSVTSAAMRSIAWQPGRQGAAF